MLVGYMRVSKADSSQVDDILRDAFLTAGVQTAHLYEDTATDCPRSAPDRLVPPTVKLDVASGFDVTIWLPKELLTKKP